MKKLSAGRHSPGGASCNDQGQRPGLANNENAFEPRRGEIMVTNYFAHPGLICFCLLRPRGVAPGYFIPPLRGCRVLQFFFSPLAFSPPSWFRASCASLRKSLLGKSLTRRVR